MPYDDDVIEIVTPERVELNFPIAGLGSRFVALLVDLMVIGALITTLILVEFAVNRYLLADIYLVSLSSSAFLIAVAVINLGYFIIFEYLWNGQTPGKRYVKIRVMRKGGLPVNFASAVIRNLMRPVDIMLFSVAIGFLVLFLSKQSQRPGDFAAGTLVVRERNITLSDLDIYLKKPQQENLVEPIRLDNRFSRLDNMDAHLLDQFMTRRGELGLDQRQELAKRIADSIRIKLKLKPDEYESNELLIKAAYKSVKERQANW
jgi:uncharacterized RDD family membrane protein YckC